MQLKIEHIAKKAAEKTSLDEDVLLSIGKSVFKETYNKIKHPESIIVYLQYIGKIYARRKKTEEGLKKIDYLLANPRPNVTIENLIRNKNSMNFLLDKYKEFVQIKNQYRNAKNNNTNNKLG